MLTWMISVSGYHFGQDTPVILTNTRWIVGLSEAQDCLFVDLKNCILSILFYSDCQKNWDVEIF